LHCDYRIRQTAEKGGLLLIIANTMTKFVIMSYFI